MRRTFLKLAGLGFGATLGGLLVGLLEALYFGVSPLYAALLYGSLWAIAGAALALLLAPWWRGQPVPTTQVRWGLAAAIVPSSLVLIRFVVQRDLLAESPRGGLVATGIAMIVAVALLVAIIAGARVIRRRLAVEQMFGAKAWLVPLAVLAAFTIRAQAGDDALPETAPPARPAGGSGVVLVVFDALRADALGVYGAGPHRGKPASPTFDALAQRGLVFHDLSAQASWTRPAVASLLTSRHVSGHATMAKTAVLPETLPTIASVLAAAGVKTGAVVTNYNLEPGYGFARGFDEFRYLAPARYLGAPERANRLAAYNVYRLLRERFLRHQRQARHFYRSGQVVNALALEMADRLGDGRFFLYLHYMEPHDPFFAVDGSSWAKVSDPNPPAAWAGRMREAYADEVHRSDRALAELLAGLEQRFGDRVTVVVTSDHGEEFGDHNGFYHGTTLYEELLHLPLIIAGRVPPGVDTELARQIDLAPTITGLLGVAPPPGWEGRDLLGPGPRAAVSLAEQDHEGNRLESLRRGGDKLILANPDNPRGLQPVELYDLAADPREMDNLAAGAGELREQLGELLEAAKRAAAQGGARAADKTIDGDAAAELRALGYVE